MTKLISLCICITFVNVQALTISEVMSNPVGDDSGREWVELFNDTDHEIDLSALTVSIKGGNAVSTTNMQGGNMLSSGRYAIIGSIVNGGTKFLTDYPSYTGIVMKSAISLVNTGVTSIDIKLNGTSVDSIASYSAAKEGYTYSKIGGSFVTSSPTPGAINQLPVDTGGGGDGSSTTTANQISIAQTSPPSSDIVIYLPSSLVVVAGAPHVFSLFSLTRSGQSIANVSCAWSFGDGGQAYGTSTRYRYEYAGQYIAQIECGNGLVIGTGRISVRVVAPDIKLSPVLYGKYGPYVVISNPNTYDLDLSYWRLAIDATSFVFPKNTVIGVGDTRISGNALGFSSTTVSSSSVIKILFPTQEEVTRALAVPTSGSLGSLGVATSPPSIAAPKVPYIPKSSIKKVEIKNDIYAIGTGTKASARIKQPTRDTRIAGFFRSLLGNAGNP